MDLDLAHEWRSAGLSTWTLSSRHQATPSPEGTADVHRQLVSDHG